MASMPNKRNRKGPNMMLSHAQNQMRKENKMTAKNPADTTTDPEKMDQDKLTAHDKELQRIRAEEQKPGLHEAGPGAAQEPSAQEKEKEIDETVTMTGPIVPHEQKSFEEQVVDNKKKEEDVTSSTHEHTEKEDENAAKEREKQENDKLEHSRATALRAARRASRRNRV